MDGLKFRYRKMTEDCCDPMSTWCITDFRHKRMLEFINAVIRKLEPEYGETVQLRIKQEENADE